MKSVQEGQSNLCLTLRFRLLSAALSTLQGYSSAPVTGESFVEKVSLAHQPDHDRAFIKKKKSSLGGGILHLNVNGIAGWFYQSKLPVTQFPLCLKAPLRTEKQYCIYILSFTMSQFFHKVHSFIHLTSDRSPKCE